MRAFFGKLKPQIELAAASNARLAIENHSGALLHSPDSFKAFLDINPAPEELAESLIRSIEYLKERHMQVIR
jgi:hypothetical protein